MINPRLRCWWLVACALALALSACGSPNAMGVLPAAAPPTAAPVVLPTTVPTATDTPGPYPPTPVPPVGPSVEESGAQLLTSNNDSLMVVAGDYRFWWANDSTEQRRRVLYGLDQRTQVRFLITNVAADEGSVVSDGQIVLWTNGAQISQYDLRTHQTTTVIDAPRADFGRLALADGVVYYTSRLPGHRGLFAHVLATGAESLIAEQGLYPVVADGKLLWSTWIGQNDTLPHTENWSLTLRHLDGSQPDVVVIQMQTGQEGFERYAVAGDYVVWTIPFSPVPNSGRVGLYDIRSGRNTFLTPEGTRSFGPIITDQMVVWSASMSTINMAVWSLHRYNLADGSTQVLITTRMGELRARTMIPDQPHRLVFSAYQGTTINWYLLDLA